MRIGADPSAVIYLYIMSSCAYNLRSSDQSKPARKQTKKRRSSNKNPTRPPQAHQQGTEEDPAETIPLSKMTTSTLITFNQFRRLPAELRDLIWREAIRAHPSLNIYFRTPQAKSY
jgi:hypothetical protein